MISIGAGKSASGVGNYFKQPDYYTKDADKAKGVWLGKGAALLRLKGIDFTTEDFVKYLDGQFPDRPSMGKMVDGKRVRQPSWDNVVSAPPSMTVAIEVFGLKDLDQVNAKSAINTAQYIEKNSLYVKPWDNEKKKQVPEKAKAGLIASFRHRTSRNLDPSTHTHLNFSMLA